MELQQIKYQKSYLTGSQTIEYSLASTRDERNNLIALLCEASLVAARLARHDRRPHPPAETYNTAVKGLAEIFKPIQTDTAVAQIEEHYRWVLQSAAALTLNMDAERANPIAAEVAEKFRLPLAEKSLAQAGAESGLAEAVVAVPEFPAPRADHVPAQNFDTA